MGVFRAVFGRRGDGSFSDLLLGVSSGVVGFNAAMFPRLVRDILRPARPDAGASASAKKLTQHPNNGPQLAFDGALGEFFRGNAAEGAVWGEYSSRTSSRGIPPGECVAPCAWQPDPSTGIRTQATTYRACVRIKGPARRMRSQKQKWSLTSRRRPDALYIPMERTEAAAPSALKSHATSDTWCPITPKTGQLPAKRAGEYENPRASREARGLCAETAGFEPARGYAPLPP